LPTSKSEGTDSHGSVIAWRIDSEIFPVASSSFVTFTGNAVADRDDVARLHDAPVRELGRVHEPGDAGAQIDERAELREPRDAAGHHGALDEGRADRLHLLLVLRLDERAPRDDDVLPAPAELEDLERIRLADVLLGMLGAMRVDLGLRAEAAAASDLHLVPALDHLLDGALNRLARAERADHRRIAGLARCGLLRLDHRCGRGRLRGRLGGRCFRGRRSGLARGRLAVRLRLRFGRKRGVLGLRVLGGLVDHIAPRSGSSRGTSPLGTSARPIIGPKICTRGSGIVP
jgi:hypothetical protein